MKQGQRLTNLGKLIRQARLDAGWTQQRLGEECGFDATYISMLERGRRNPPFLTLACITRKLQMPLHKLLKTFSDTDKD